MAGKLTPKQKAFVEEYIVDLNATQAAIRAGYSEKTADRIGPKLVVKSCVAEAIQKAMKQRENRTQITQDRVLNELAKIAFADSTQIAEVVTTECPTTVTTEDGGTETVMKEKQIVKLKDTAELSDDQRAAISGIKEGRYGIEVGSYDKVKALELLGRHLGIFNDKLKMDGGSVKVVIEGGEDLED